MNINNKFNFTRFFFQNLIVGKSSMTKNTFQSVDVSISEKSILTKHDLINEENSTLFFIRKQDLNMQSLSTGICMFSIALAFFFLYLVLQYSKLYFFFVNIKQADQIYFFK